LTAHTVKELFFCYPSFAFKGLTLMVSSSLSPALTAEALQLNHTILVYTQPKYLKMPTKGNPSKKVQPSLALLL